MCNFPKANRVKFASGILEGASLTFWNEHVQLMGIEMPNVTPWSEFKNLFTDEYCSRDDVQKLETEHWNHKMGGSEIEAYTTRANELATLCQQMVAPTSKRIELCAKGLATETHERHLSQPESYPCCSKIGKATH